MTLVSWLYGVFVGMGSPLKARYALDRLQCSRRLTRSQFADLRRLVSRYYDL